MAHNYLFFLFTSQFSALVEPNRACLSCQTAMLPFFRISIDYKDCFFNGTLRSRCFYGLLHVTSRVAR